jgi:hypothetical protein
MRSRMLLCTLLLLPAVAAAKRNVASGPTTALALAKAHAGAGLVVLPRKGGVTWTISSDNPHGALVVERGGAANEKRVRSWQVEKGRIVSVWVAQDGREFGPNVKRYASYNQAPGTRLKDYLGRIDAAAARQRR